MAIILKTISIIAAQTRLVVFLTFISATSLYAAEEVCGGHILLSSSTEAQKIISKLEGGANFEDLARAYSIGPSGPNGGSLGCFQKGEMVETFEVAAFAIEAGNFSKKPVQTQFGFHVIRITHKTRNALPKLLHESRKKQQFKPMTRMHKNNPDRDGVPHYADDIEVMFNAEINKLRIRIIKIVNLYAQRHLNSQCAIGDVEILELDGPIGPDSTAVVSRVIDRLTPCLNENREQLPHVVALNSAGGLLVDGLKLGEMFRERNIQTTVFDGGVCASACTVAFMGGVKRSMATDAYLMFHSPYEVVKSGSSYSFDCSNKDVLGFMKEYYLSMLGEQNGAFVNKRTMDYCGGGDGWTINRDAAAVFGIVNLAESPFKRWSQP